jgi:hypothetical protein
VREPRSARAGTVRRAARTAAAALLLLLAACACAPAPEEPPDSGRPAGAGPGSSAGPGTPSAAARWQPRPGTPWQWQLSGTVDTSVDVPVYDIDGFENGAAVVRTLHTAGRKVICYVNAGAWESFRPDAEEFPTALLGRGDGWEGERWLDIRRIDELRPLMASRFDMCRKKGFDAVEPDLLEGYANTTGFPLTAAHQLAYNRMIARLAHDRGLAVGLKNDLGQVPDLVSEFDFSVDEQCAQFHECAQLTPFVEADKAVFHAEYELAPERFCPDSRRLGLSSVAKHLELDAWRAAC